MPTTGPCPSQGQSTRTLLGQPQALLLPRPEGEGEEGTVGTVVLECWGQVMAIVLIQPLLMSQLSEQLAPVVVAQPTPLCLLFQCLIPTQTVL